MPNKDPFIAGKSIAAKHGAAGYELSGRLPAEYEGYDIQLAQELQSLVGGNDRFALACMLTARRQTMVELAFSWLAREDVPVFWIEQDEEGRNIVRFQPVLNRLFGWMNGLRLDLMQLNLTPAQAARIAADGDALDAAVVLEALQEQ